MQKIIVQPLGGTLLAGIESDNVDEISLQYNSWYNWSATNGSLFWGKDDPPIYFAYIISTHKKYKEYLFNVLENRFAKKTGYEFEGKTHIERIKKHADE